MSDRSRSLRHSRFQLSVRTALKTSGLLREMSSQGPREKKSNAMMIVPRLPSGFLHLRRHQDLRRDMVRARTTMTVAIMMTTHLPLHRAGCCAMKRPSQTRSCSAVHPKAVSGRRGNYRPEAYFYLSVSAMKLLCLNEILRSPSLVANLHFATVVRPPWAASKYLPRHRLITETRTSIDPPRKSATASPSSTVNYCKMTLQ